MSNKISSLCLNKKLKKKTHSVLNGIYYVNQPRGMFGPFVDWIFNSNRSQSSILWKVFFMSIYVNGVHGVIVKATSLHVLQ